MPPEPKRQRTSQTKSAKPIGQALQWLRQHKVTVSMSAVALCAIGGIFQAVINQWSPVDGFLKSKPLDKALESVQWWWSQTASIPDPALVVACGLLCYLIWFRLHCLFKTYRSSVNWTDQDIEILKTIADHEFTEVVNEDFLIYWKTLNPPELSMGRLLHILDNLADKIMVRRERRFIAGHGDNTVIALTPQGRAECVRLKLL